MTETKIKSATKPTTIKILVNKLSYTSPIKKSKTSSINANISEFNAI